MRRLAYVTVLCATICSRAYAADPESKDDAAQVLQKVTEEGPIVATVTVSPKTPVIGDVIALTLKVVAEPTAQVKMPDLGEALGRFAVLDQKLRQSSENGKQVFVQEYRLQPHLSGRQRIPALRVEYATAKTTKQELPNEVLTEEISLDVGSVLAAGEKDLTLTMPQSELSATVRDFRPLWWSLAGALALGLVVGGWLFRKGQHKAKLAQRKSAFEMASLRLFALRQKGLPEEENSDSWYVELSDIVRRYVEDRFAIRAPELTTEEFLREVKRSPQLVSNHKELLSQFLDLCDRVKFAGLRPDAAQSEQALILAERFISETKPAPVEPSASSANVLNFKGNSPSDGSFTNQGDAP